MKTLFLTMTAPVLLMTLGFGQAPAPTSTDPASIKGCLGGSEGNYTVAEDGTTQTFKVTSSTVDLKPHVGHDIAVTGQKATTGSDPADNSVAITAVNMISEQCTPATTSEAPAASAPTVADSTPAAPTSAPVVADTTPGATTTTTITTTTPVAVDATPEAASTPVAADPSPVTVASAPVVADPPQTVAANAPAQSVTSPDDSQQLPNTASSLPLVGLLGLGMLGLGLWGRKSHAS